VGANKELSSQTRKIAVSGPWRVGINPHEVSIEENWITVDAARMRYLRAGAGPVLLLVHGLLGYSFSWRFTIPSLARCRSVYAVDLMGAGFSDRPAGLDCSLKASAERVLRFMDAASLPACDLLGTSHGGAVAMMMAALAPERVRRLILADPVNPWSAHGKWLTVFLSSAVIAPLFLRLAPRVRILDDLYLRRMFGDPRRIPPDSLEGYRKPLLAPRSFEYGLAVARSWNRDLRELESVMTRIEHIPTLLLWGSRDAAVDPGSAAQLKDRFRNCHLVIFEGAGHLPYEEVPDEFNDAVAGFLSSNLH
jgi:pimeloyl-ACP methyl ester carboxylesterase